ncbi:MAG: hypothetical protein DYH03_05420 [Nitrospira sp. NTP1]|nr:hypothetical protein [Nitrospira sp. NTP1]
MPEAQQPKGHKLHERRFTAPPACERRFTNDERRSGNPANPINQFNFNNPFNPVNQYRPENPLNPINEFNPTVPFAPLDGGSGMGKRR